MKQKIYGLVLSPSMSICGLLSFESLRAKSPIEWNLKYYGNELDRKTGNYETVLRSCFTDYRIHKPGHDSLFNGQPVVVYNGGKPVTLTGHVVDVSGIPAFTVGLSDQLHRVDKKLSPLTISDAAAIMFIDPNEQIFPGTSSVYAEIDLFLDAEDEKIRFDSTQAASEALRQAARSLLKSADEFDAKCAAADFVGEQAVVLSLSADQCLSASLSTSGTTRKADPEFVLRLLRDQLMTNITNAQRKEELLKHQKTLAEQLEQNAQELAKLG